MRPSGMRRGFCGFVDTCPNPQGDTWSGAQGFGERLFRERRTRRDRRAPDRASGRAAGATGFLEVRAGAEATVSSGREPCTRMRLPTTGRWKRSWAEQMGSPADWPPPPESSAPGGDTTAASDPRPRSTGTISARVRSRAWPYRTRGPGHAQESFRPLFSLPFSARTSNRERSRPHPVSSHHWLASDGSFSKATGSRRGASHTMCCYGLAQSGPKRPNEGPGADALSSARTAEDSARPRQDPKTPRAGSPRSLAAPRGSTAPKPSSSSSAPAARSRAGRRRPCGHRLAASDRRTLRLERYPVYTQRRPRLDLWRKTKAEASLFHWERVSTIAFWSSRGFKSPRVVPQLGLGYGATKSTSSRRRQRVRHAPTGNHHQGHAPGPLV
jgi:hypothetical protein